jgi:hypothetical protein
LIIYRNSVLKISDESMAGAGTVPGEKGSKDDSGDKIPSCPAEGQTEETEERRGERTRSHLVSQVNKGRMEGSESGTHRTRDNPASGDAARHRRLSGEHRVESEMLQDLSSEIIRRRDTGTGARATGDEVPTQGGEPVRAAAAAATAAAAVAAAAAVTSAAAVGEAALRTAAATESFKEPAKEDTGAVRKVVETKTLAVSIPVGGGGEKAGSSIPEAPPEGPPREAELGARRKSPRRRSPHSGNILGTYTLIYSCRRA